MLGGQNFPNRAGRGCHIKYERLGIARNSDGDRVCPDECFRPAMWMNESFTYGHGDTNETLTRLLLTIIPDHPQVTAVPNRYGNDPSLAQRRFCNIERGIGNEGAQAILSVHAQNRIRGPRVRGIDIHPDEALFNTRRKHRQPLQSVRMMSAQITLGQNVRLNRTLLLVGSQPGEDVKDQLSLVLWRNDYWRLKREAHGFFSAGSKSPTRQSVLATARRARTRSNPRASSSGRG